MCWMCDHPGATIEDYLDHVADLLRGKMRRRGWAIQYVEDARRPFAYTIGLTDRGLPELLVTGISPQRAVELLSAGAELAALDGALAPGEQITLPSGRLAEVVEVEYPDAHLCAAIGLFGPKVRALQLVWADWRGRWPWAPDFNDGGAIQPVLGVRAAAWRRHTGQDGKS